MNSFLQNICQGGKKSNSYFGYLQDGQFMVGWRHQPLSKINRLRYFNSNALKYPLDRKKNFR